MKPGRLREVVAVIWLGTGVVNGVSAFGAHNEAVQAEGTATALEAQGNPQAAEWQAYADDQEYVRNRFLAFVALDLSAACLAVALPIPSSRRREQGPQPDTPEQ